MGGRGIDLRLYAFDVAQLVRALIAFARHHVLANLAASLVVVARRLPPRHPFLECQIEFDAATLGICAVNLVPAQVGVAEYLLAFRGFRWRLQIHEM